VLSIAKKVNLINNLGYRLIIVQNDCELFFVLAEVNHELKEMGQNLELSLY